MKIAAAIMTAFFIVPALYVPVSAELIFLKNGAIIKGRLVSENAAAVRFIDERGAGRFIPRVSVLRILYMDIYMGRMVVRLTDGSSINAYLVFEDSDAYTFRNELYEPDEFIVPRKKVLFMARTNPTDLVGRGYKDSIALSWAPPYQPPASYNIYCKEANAPAYRIAGTTRSTRYVIRDLKKKTGYAVKVTAVGHNGLESLPCDEFTVMTNVPPSLPRRFSRKRRAERGRLSLALSWKSASDSDGTVKKYRVYSRDDTRCKLVDETEYTGCTIKDLDPDDIHYFSLRSVDDNNGESDDLRFNSKPVDIDLEARASYIVPLSRLGRVLNWGYGFAGSLSLAHVPVRSFTVGVGAGYYQFLSKSKRIKTAHMTPFYANMQYQFRLTAALSLSPEIAAGASLVEITGTNRKYFSAESPALLGKSIEPYVRAGALLSFTIKDWFFINLHTGYALVLEGTRCIDFFECGFSVVFRM